MKTITPKELHERLSQGKAVELIDVRTPVEFREIHVQIARNEPLDSLDPEQLIAGRNGDGDEPLYVICNSGNRSTKACEKFLACGYDNVVNVAGGTAAWDSAGLPVTRGKKAMSLERQVRIAAGSLVVLGVVLGFFLHPAFLVLSAFVGAGLVYAGITDSCGMAMLLAKAPWNQVRCEVTPRDSASDKSSCCS